MESIYLNTFDHYNELKHIITYIKGYYSNFWKKIINNVTLKYHREAIYTLKSSNQIENEEFILNTHTYINQRLYTGKCKLRHPNNLKKLGYEVSSERLCDFILDSINYFDKSIDIAPKLDINLTVFRMSSRTDITKLKKGDFFIERNYSSTSLNPGIPFNFFDYNNLNLYFEIILPKKTSGFYYNIPYYYEKDKNVEEDEFILPRNSIYRIVNKKYINVFGYKIMKFILLYIKTEDNSKKIDKYNQQLESSIISYKKKVCIPELFNKIFASKFCFTFFELCNLIHKKKIEYNKIYTTLDIKKKDGFKKAKKNFKLYQTFSKFKKLQMNDIYKCNKLIFASYIFINAFKIYDIEEIMGEPYKKEKLSTFIVEYNIKKGIEYKAKKINIKSLSINTRVILRENIKFKVKKVSKIFDRDLNRINYIILESI